MIISPQIDSLQTAIVANLNFLLVVFDFLFVYSWPQIHYLCRHEFTNF